MSAPEFKSTKRHCDTNAPMYIAGQSEGKGLFSSEGDSLITLTLSERFGFSYLLILSFPILKGDLFPGNCKLEGNQQNTNCQVIHTLFLIAFLGNAAQV